MWRVPNLFSSFKCWLLHFKCLFLKVCCSNSGCRGGVGGDRARHPWQPKAVGQRAGVRWGLVTPMLWPCSSLHLLPVSTKAMVVALGPCPSFPAGRGVHSAVLCRRALLLSSSCCEKLKELETIVCKPVISNYKSVIGMLILNRESAKPLWHCLADSWLRIGFWYSLFREALD